MVLLINMKFCWQGVDKWATEKELAEFIKKLLQDTIEGIQLAKPPKKNFAFLLF